MKRSHKDIYILLHDIRSAHNVGSIFRTADAARVSKIFLTGHTPAPTDRFGRPVKEIAKVALGAEGTVPWEYARDGLELIKALKNQPDGKELQIIALEQDERSVDYKKVKVGGAAVIIVGNEVNGLPKNILDQCDVIAEIPMKGKKESLNVGVALGVALFRILGI